MHRELPVLREEGRAGQMDCFGDGLLAEPATAPTVDDEVPRKPAFHVSKHVCNKDARAFECDASVADFWVGHDVPAQFDAPLVVSDGANLPGKPSALKRVVAKGWTTKQATPVVYRLGDKTAVRLPARNGAGEAGYLDFRRSATSGKL
jgi:hypothetical protein